MRFEEGVDYNEIDRDKNSYRYELVRTYVHADWAKAKPHGAIGSDRIGSAQFRQGHALVLDKGYRWNGCDFAPEQAEAMRASAVHDAWCRAMAAGQIAKRPQELAAGGERVSRHLQGGWVARVE